ncbi:MAG: choice-of-anchor Q domain-containing protein, partial [Pyrinomonadaceae bacterium]
VVNSTISGNTASSGTGGIIAAGPSGYIANSTVVKNRAGTSFSDFGSGGVAGTATLTSSIVAQNIQGPNTPPNLRGTFTSQGYNVIESTDGSMFTAGQGDQIVVSETQLALGPLQDNGGPTLTHAPGTGSVAIDQGIANSLTTDQRGTGFPRTNDDPAVANAVGGDGTDTGAFEVHQDTDGDGIVDALDPDDDDDGVPDGEDAFPLDSDETTDTDSDGTGDNADTDDDGDGVLDGADNCPLNANADQADFDLDGIGDACDPATGPPTNKNQCKNGGWMRFDTPSFGNQGDCTRFLRTGG